MRRSGLVPALIVPLSLAAAGCAAGGGGASPCLNTSRMVVVAAENFWGSLAQQIAGDRACVASIVVNPATDPHAYEPAPADARLVAAARYLVVNGAGYDAWALQLAAAGPSRGRVTYDVAAAAGRRQGDNPHVWYSPDVVDQAVDRIASDLSTVDPAGADYFRERRDRLRSSGLGDYHAAIDAIRARYSGLPVGATESIVADLTSALGLKLLTPPAYLQAISEGTDPSTADRAEMDRQLATRSIRALIYNRQNSTRDVQGVVAHARRQSIPVVEVTETLSPAGDTFQAWQTRQLRALQAALGG